MNVYIVYSRKTVNKQSEVDNSVSRRWTWTFRTGTDRKKPPGLCLRQASASLMLVSFVSFPLTAMLSLLLAGISSVLAS